MNETLSTPALASVVVLKIREFPRRPVTEQVKLKTQLEALVALAIGALPAAERIVLDTPDGAAIVVLGSPRDALDLAKRSQAAAADLPLCIGVNHGPVKPVSDALRGSGLVGDGVAAGTTLANAATPDRLLVSRSFHEALEAVAPGRAAELSPAGVFTDASVRTYELYTLDRGAARARRRQLFAAGAVTVISILGLGVLARSILHVDSAPARPAVIEFAITPRGDVYIDGVLKGRAPPLKRLEVSPGPHTIELRNSPHAPLKLEVNLGPAEEMTIAHSFTKPKSAAKSKSAGDYVRDLRRQLGF